MCVNVDYRLAPEFSFPIPVNDAWDSLKWVSIAFDEIHFQATDKDDPSRSLATPSSSALIRHEGSCSMANLQEQTWLL